MHNPVSNNRSSSSSDHITPVHRDNTGSSDAAGSLAQRTVRQASSSSAIRATRTDQTKSTPLGRRNVDFTPPQEQAASSAVAGHAGTFQSFGKYGFLKIASSQEKAAYDKYGNKLKDVIPRQLDVHSVKHNLRSTQEGERYLLLENITSMTGNNSIDLDLKIGKSTASKTLLKNENHSSSNMKKIRTTFADIAYGSRTRGYRLEGSNITDNERLCTARNTKNNLRQALSRIPKSVRNDVIKRILDGIKNIKIKTTENAVSFIGSSIFISIEPSSPQKTVVKLIDLAHVVDRETTTGNHLIRKHAQFNSGLDALSNTFFQLKS